MGWAKRLAIAAAIFVYFTACTGRATYSTPGTLYVEFAGAGNVPAETTAVRGGRVIGHKPVGFIVARDHADRWLVASDAPVCNGPYGYRAFLLSPDGTHVLCSKGEDIRIFERSHPQRARVLVRHFEENADYTSFAWLNDARIVALVLDQSCPNAHLYGFFPTRVETVDTSGRPLGRGPCAFGVVAARGRMALLGERSNSVAWHIKQFFADDPRYYNDGYGSFHHTWSIDNGKTWNDGTPLAFDGNGRLLYRAAFGDDIKTEDGQTVFKSAYSVQWSR